jgi:hypothetical protein
MFAISREEMLAGLEHMEENKLTYYDAHCPKCRRANRVERARMERFFPDWKTAIKIMAKGADQTEDTISKPAPAIMVPKTPVKAKKKHTRAPVVAKVSAKVEKKPSPKPKGKTSSKITRIPAPARKK